MDIQHAHNNATTAEILRQYRYQVTTPLERLLFDRLDQADDVHHEAEPIENAAFNLSESQDSTIGSAIDGLESIIRVHDAILEDNPMLSDAIHQLMERTDDARTHHAAKFDAIEWQFPGE